ncbi:MULTISPECIES: GNAT family N-acetyltransferase [Aeromonas]|uniref:GNAT family N-acetyltransferase n=1 Tax=Aeromonas TaxID=642 RepID=UPI001C24EA3C|nr:MULTISPECIES: N-acetyltransferase [Aeromonas]MDH0174864.1 N-acetyltransferase [Aeromonas dhakensis]QXC06821.1 N-acetyltransferase [Aeromonas sp. FDAARGOS 1408]
MNILIRPETVTDHDAIEAVTVAAFFKAPHTDHNEQLIVRDLRQAGALSLSLVAEQAGQVVGHLCFSPVTISDGSERWYGLGPISVSPELHGKGLGSRLMEAGLAELKGMGAAGCVVLGDPGFYGRFGFVSEPGLTLPGVPAEYFMARSFGVAMPSGEVRYHQAFEQG